MRLLTHNGTVNMTDVYERHRDESTRILEARARLGYAIEEALKTPGIERVVGYGYTPAWNDGEPCEHRDYVWGNRSFSDYDRVVVMTDDGVPGVYDVDSYDREDEPNWPWDVIDAALALPPASVQLGDLEEALGTNWCLYADHTGIYVGPYDPGY